DADADLDEIERRLRAAIAERLIPDTKVELDFRRSRPAFHANEASRAIARHAQQVFNDMGLPLVIRDRASGGGTDAAYAAVRPLGGVLEGFGARGYGAHSDDNEWIVVPSLGPRL